MGEYTTILKNYIYDGDITSKEIMSFLNNQDNFKNFGNSLTYFIENLFHVEDAYQYLIDAYKKHNIKYTRSTLKNWFFHDKGPKSSGSNRINVYKIAFALELNVDQTSQLFIEVYHDRPFDLRQLNEFVYYCCLNLGYSYSKAESLIESISQEFNDESTHYTIHTQTMIKDAKKIKDEEEIIWYIRHNRSNFDYYMLSARRVLNSLIEMVKLNEEDIKRIKRGRYIDVTSAIAKEHGEAIFEDDALANKSLTSINTMFDLILYFNFSQKRKENKNFIKNAKLLDEIKTCFPTVQTLAKETPTYEELRKLIIFLGSYNFWVEVQVSMTEGYKMDKHQVLEDYQCEINDLLSSSNLPLLYVGNAYDWLFLYCSLVEEDESPLDKFRNILFEAFEV